MTDKEPYKVYLVRVIRTELSEYLATVKRDPSNNARLLTIAHQIHHMAERLIDASHLLD